MRILTYLLFSLLLTACAAPLLPPAALPEPATLAESSAAWYLKAARQGQQVYRIDPARSLISIIVRRGGALARLGHDHVVASRTVTGFVAPQAGRADFEFRLDQMTVDETALRIAAGLDTQPSPEAIAGTRTNMLGKVLEAERYPLVKLQAQRISGAAHSVRLSVSLHGVMRTMTVPVRLAQSASTITANGELSLLQSDFGITPMSVMGGAIAVQDRMELQFALVAVR